MKRRRYVDLVPVLPRRSAPPWRRPSSGALVAGEVSVRAVYRWLRAQRRSCGDVYLRIEWDLGGEPLGVLEPDDGPQLPDAVWTALWAFELPCKLLDVGPSSMELRTRSWRGAERRVRHPRHPARGWEPQAQRIDGWPTDRALGLRYARLLAALLRAAHRGGVRLTVRRLP